MLVIGETLMDLIATHEDGAQSTIERPGGSPANVAYGLARLGNDVELVTHLGDDERGETLRHWLAGAGVRVTNAGPAGARTFTARARLAADGSAEYAFDGSWELTAAYEPPAVPALHIGSIGAVVEPGATRVGELVQRLHGRCLISYDPNVRPQLMGAAAQLRPRVEDLVASSDVVKVSSDDLTWLHPQETVDERARRWVAAGPALVVVTLGADGVRAFTRQRAVWTPTLATRVVDTVGAGDAFMAGLLDALGRAGLRDAAHREAIADLDERALRSLLRRASAVAALTVAHRGARLPDLAEVEKFLAQAD